MFDFKHDSLIKSASYLSVLVAIIIVGIKTFGWLETGSQSVLASLIDSMLDISSSLINLVAIRVSLQPPDHNHRFGHEKFQDLAIFSQSIFFFASSLFTLFSASIALFNADKIEDINLGMNVMFVCVALTIGLVSYQSYVIKMTNSKIIAVDKLHYFTDLLASIAVIVSVYLSEKLWFIDPLFGIGISLYIMITSVKLFIQVIKNLADEEFPEESRKQILSIIEKHTEVKGVHDLKTRYAGSKPFIQCHLEMDGNMSLLEAHKISEEIIEELLSVFKGGEITIHQDPEGIEEEVNYREKIRVQ